LVLGTFVTSTTPLDDGPKRTLEPRTEHALILIPADGGWWVLLLDSYIRARRKGNGIHEQPPDPRRHRTPQRASEFESDAYAAEHRNRAETQRLQANKLTADGEWVYGLSIDKEDVAVALDDG